MEFIKKHTYFIILNIIFLLGLILRLKGYLTNPSFWLDESALGWNILNKEYLELFHKLRFLQLAPPLFLVSTKFLVFLTDSYHHVFRCDMVLRTIPFLSGVSSIWLFYLVCKKIINSKWAILAGVLLFATNPILINYSFEFKPYSTDVLCSLIALYLFLNIDFKEFSPEKLIKYGTVLAILPWFSFASVFVILAGFITLSFKRDNPSAFTTLLAPVFLSFFAYLNIFIANAYSENSTGMINYWQNQFVKKDFSNLTQLNKENLQYYFINVSEINITSMISKISFLSIYLIIKDKKFTYFIISIMTFSLTVVASIFKYYPFSRRMVIFLIPFLLIYLIKFVDLKKAYLQWCLIAVILVAHAKFAFNFLTITNLNKGDFARNMIYIISKNIETNENIILNGASNADFYYYNHFYNLKNHVIYLKPKTDNPQEIQNMLNTLEKGKYWLFLSYDYDINHINIKNMTNWAYNNAKILYEIKSPQSTLLNISIENK